MDIIFIGAIIYCLVMVANYHIPRIPTKDNPAVIKHESLDFLKQNVLDAIGGKVDLDK
jgi:hypothetical protein